MTRKFSHQMFFVGYLFIIYSFIYLFILAKINSNEAPLFCRKMDPTHLTAMCVKTCQNSQGNTCVGVSF